VTVDREDLKGMSPKRVVELHQAGELDDLLNPAEQPAAGLEETAEAVVAGSADLGARGLDPRMGQLDREALRTMTSAEIVKAQNEGRLDHLLGRQA
jgi:hypothetical protein